jgi:hypothetical protein
MKLFKSVPSGRQEGSGKKETKEKAIDEGVQMFETSEENWNLCYIQPSQIHSDT